MGPGLWVWLSRLWASWRSSLVIVQPATVLAWHRQGFRLYWRRKSRPNPVGRPRLDAELRDLIRRMARENPTWNRCPSAPALARLRGLLQRRASPPSARQPLSTATRGGAARARACGGHPAGRRAPSPLHPRRLIVSVGVPAFPRSVTHHAAHWNERPHFRRRPPFHTAILDHTLTGPAFGPSVKDLNAWPMKFLTGTGHTITDLVSALKPSRTSQWPDGPESESCTCCGRACAG
jgi:hypothetical protein